MAEHTPGPYVITPTDGSYVKRPEFSRYMIEQDSDSTDGNSLIVAVILSDCALLEAAAEANAALFRAAPDLLDALRRLVDLKDNRPADYEQAKPLAWAAARAAIAKAITTGDPR